MPFKLDPADFELGPPNQLQEGPKILKRARELMEEDSTLTFREAWTLAKAEIKGHD